MNFNFLMAITWLIVGVALLVYHFLHPDAPFLNLMGSGISAGWLCVVMAIYNLVRWWSVRSFARSQDYVAESSQRRSRSSRYSTLRPEERNPDFDFTQQPPKNDDDGHDRP